MALEFFIIPVRDDGAAEAELNAFLYSHRVLAVERRWVDQGRDSLWSFCVDDLDGPYQTPRDHSGRKRSKDHRDEPQLQPGLSCELRLCGSPYCGCI